MIVTFVQQIISHNELLDFLEKYIHIDLLCVVKTYPIKQSNKTRQNIPSIYTSIYKHQLTIFHNALLLTSFRCVGARTKLLETFIGRLVMGELNVKVIVGVFLQQ